MEDVLFHGRPFAVARGRVMAPRPATEALVDAAAARLGDRVARVADVGTGSGAVAVSLALAAPRAEVWATDTSEEAVALARANAERHGVAERVHAVCCDLLDAVPGPLALVVANLPYLPDSLPDPRYDAEPAAAIYAPGDGLDPYRRLAAQARELLADDGALLVQLHREILVAGRGELAGFAERLRLR